MTLFAQREVTPEVVDPEADPLEFVDVVSWPKLNMSRQDVIDATGTSSSSDHGWVSRGYYPQMNESVSVPFACTIEHEAAPTLQDVDGLPYAFFAALPLDEEACEVVLRASHTESIRNQIVTFTPEQEIEDSFIRARSEQSVLMSEQAMKDLEAATYAELPTFDPTLAAHPMDDMAYAGNLAAQELRVLNRNTELKNAGAETILTTQQETDAKARVVHNTLVSKGGGDVTPTSVPQTAGAARASVVLDEEDVHQARFEEEIIVWNGNNYIPRVTIDYLPDGLTMSLLYALVYDQDNVYRNWMPFADNGDGTWSTPLHTSYLSIAKSASANWRVAINYGHTSEDYQITDRVVLIPPEVKMSDIRWGGR